MEKDTEEGAAVEKERGAQDSRPARTRRGPTRLATSLTTTKGEPMSVEYTILVVRGDVRTIGKDGYLRDTWGPFTDRAAAEQCMVNLAGRPDVIFACLEEKKPDGNPD